MSQDPLHKSWWTRYPASVIGPTVVPQRTRPIPVRIEPGRSRRPADTSGWRERRGFSSLFPGQSRRSRRSPRAATENPVSGMRSDDPAVIPPAVGSAPGPLRQRSAPKPFPSRSRCASSSYSFSSPSRGRSARPRWCQLTARPQTNKSTDNAIYIILLFTINLSLFSP